MACFTKSSRADADLTEIWLFIAKDNIEAADRVFSELENACVNLADHPGIGRGRPELGKDLRSYPEGSYLIFYRPSDVGIHVVRILHGARDIPATFNQ